MIKLIIFDCYGLVLTSGYPDTAKNLTQKYGGRWQDYQKIMYFKYFNRAAERKITQKEAWQKTVEDLKLPISWQELRDLHYSFFKLDKKAIELNKKLNKDGYRTLLLSKNTRSQFSFAVKKFKLKNRFKNIINTYELNLPKASKATLKVIMKRFKVKPEEIIYADDQANNLKDARTLGVKTILVKNFPQFKKELNKYL
jgi:HAD superfamily hydrolase (TIGR01509 family)